MTTYPDDDLDPMFRDDDTDEDDTPALPPDEPEPWWESPEPFWIDEP